MSAQVLRKAAAAIRDEWSDSGPKPLGTAWHRERDFHLAVADWLDAEADGVDFALSVGVTEQQMRESEMGSPALAVARAYLGGDA